MNPIPHLIVIMSLLSFLSAGCSKQATPQSLASPAAPVLKIAVFADGRLTVDGASSTIPALRDSLQRLSEQHGVVWYYREAGQQEAPPIVTNIMQTILDARCPVRLSSRPDYSDYIDDKGRSIPIGEKP
jgi:hypothetical protein